MKDLMKEFIFTERLKKQLNGLSSNSDLIQLTPVLCFHGYPGVGKTTFAHALADHVCSDVSYFPMNEGGMNGSFIENKIKPILHTRSLLDKGDKVFGRGIILDEFHNLSPKEQDRFKTVFDGLSKTLVIICLNTTRSRQLSKCVTQPIYSRMYPINFNTRKGSEDELNDLVDKVIEKFPLLTRMKVHALLPDMRQITREGRLSQLRSA